MNDVLADVARVAARHEHAVAADDLIDRWNEIHDLIDDGHAITVTRNGQIWASITPATRPVR